MTAVQSLHLRTNRFVSLGCKNQCGSLSSGAECTVTAACCISQSDRFSALIPPVSCEYLRHFGLSLTTVSVNFSVCEYSCRYSVSVGFSVGAEYSYCSVSVGFSVCEYSYCSVSVGFSVCEYSYCSVCQWAFQCQCEYSYCSVGQWAFAVCEYSYCSVCQWAFLCVNTHTVQCVSGLFCV